MTATTALQALASSTGPLTSLGRTLSGGTGTTAFIGIQNDHMTLQEAFPGLQLVPVDTPGTVNTTQPLVEQISADLGKLAAFGPALLEPAQRLQGLNLNQMLPGQCDQVQAVLATVKSTASGLFDQLNAYVTELSNDSAALTAKAQDLTAQEAGVTEQISNAQQQIADLQSQINAARERQSDESWIPIFGDIISDLDNLIDNLVNATNAKQDEMNDLSNQLSGLTVQAAQLATENARLSSVTPSLNAVLGVVNQLSAITADLESKVTAVSQAVADSEGLPPLIAAAVDDYNTAMQWCAQLAGTQLPSN